MVTEVFTRKFCDPHTVGGEKVEATEVIQFAFDGAIREVDACVECKKEYDSRFEPLVDYSRPVKRRRKSKSDTAGDTASAESTEEPAEQTAAG